MQFRALAMLAVAAPLRALPDTAGSGAGRKINGRCRGRAANSAAQARSAWAAPKKMLVILQKV